MSKKIEKELDFAEYEIDEDQKAAVKIANVEAKYEKAFDEFDKAAGRKKAAAQEKRFQTALAEKATKDAAQKEIDNITEHMSPAQKERLLAAMGVVVAPVSEGKAKYDHETTMKNLIDDTEEAVALMEKLKNDYEAVHYMGSLCDYWKSLMPLDRVQKNAHSAFNKYFKKYQHQYGLPPATPSTAGSKTSSRAVSVIGEEEEEEEMEEEDDEEAGAA